MARKVYLSAGHSNVKGKDQGAEGNGYIEGVLAVEFVELLKAALISKGATPVVDKYSNVLADTMSAFKNLVGTKDLAIDIHWNAATPQATGTEIIIPGRAGVNEASSYEKSLGTSMSSLIADTLSIKNRGVKTEKDTARKTLGWMRIPCENILIEMCFISNKDDMKRYQDNKVALADKMADLIIKNL